MGRRVLGMAISGVFVASAFATVARGDDPAPASSASSASSAQPPPPASSSASPPAPFPAPTPAPFRAAPLPPAASPTPFPQPYAPPAKNPNDHSVVAVPKKTHWASMTGQGFIIGGVLGLVNFGALEAGAFGVAGNSDCTGVIPDHTYCSDAGLDKMSTARALAEAGQWILVVSSVFIAGGIIAVIAAPAATPVSPTTPPQQGVASLWVGAGPVEAGAAVEVGGAF